MTSDRKPSVAVWNTSVTRDRAGLKPTPEARLNGNGGGFIANVRLSR